MGEGEASSCVEGLSSRASARAGFHSAGEGSDWALLATLGARMQMQRGMEVQNRTGWLHVCCRSDATYEESRPTPPPVHCPLIDGRTDGWASASFSISPPVEARPTPPLMSISQSQSQIVNKQLLPNCQNVPDLVHPSPWHPMSSLFLSQLRPANLTGFRGQPSIGPLNPC